MTALYYCPAELEILKCCPKGENINVVNASCTNQLGFDDFIKRVEPTVISEFRNIRMDDYRLIIFRKSLLLPCNYLLCITITTIGNLNNLVLFMKFYIYKSLITHWCRFSSTFFSLWSHGGCQRPFLFTHALLEQILEQARRVWFLVLSICICLVKSIKISICKWDFLKIINLYRMAGMNKTMLTVSNDKNLKLNFTKNGGLFYKGRIFSKVRQWNLILHY